VNVGQAIEEWFLCSVISGVGQFRPHLPRQLIGDRDARLVHAASDGQFVHATTERSVMAGRRAYHRPGAVNEQCPQVRFAPFIDAEQSRLAPGRVLPRH